MSEIQKFRVLIVGEGGVGKTTFMNRSLHNQFCPDTELTVGVDFFQRTIKLPEGEVKFIIWDFGGQERFIMLHEDQIMKISGAFLMFDLTRADTLRRVEFWTSDICRRYNKNIPILFLGSKADLEDQIIIDNDYVENIVREFNFFKYLRISSKTGLNIERSFELLGEELLRIKKNAEDK